MIYEAASPNRINRFSNTAEYANTSQARASSPPIHRAGDEASAQRHSSRKIRGATVDAENKVNQTAFKADPRKSSRSIRS